MMPINDDGELIEPDALEKDASSVLVVVRASPLASEMSLERIRRLAQVMHETDEKRAVREPEGFRETRGHSRDVDEMVGERLAGVGEVRHVRPSR